MAEAIELKQQRTVFDLDTMDEVLVFKTGAFTPVETAKEALDRLANDSGKFLKVINEGLRAEAQRNLVNDESIGWQEEDEDGTVKPFNGTPADSKVVNPLILTLAKTIYGYNKDMSADQKRAAKEAAMAMIKTNEPMKAGLKANAAKVAAGE